MKQYYIYLTTNLINGKKYIGQHYGELEDNYLGSGSELKIDIKKYGKNNFSKIILEICNSYSELNQAECKWIKDLNAVQDENYYNIATGGGNGNPLAGLSEQKLNEMKHKWSFAVKGERNYFYGKHFQGKDHPMWGKHHTNESKERMRQAKIGGKAPTAKSVAIYDLFGNYVRSFETQRELKIFLGLSPNGSTDTLKKYIENNKPYHGYIVKYI